MKKFMALLLAALMLLGVFIACENKNPNKDDGTTNSDGAETSSEISDKYAHNVPDGLNYDGYTYMMAFPTPADGGLDYQFKEEGDVLTAIDAAVYNRNKQVEGKFNITIDAMIVGQSDTQVTEMIPLVMAGDDSVDVGFIAFTFGGIPWITSGYAMDWNDVEYIDLEREYWTKSMTESLSVAGRSFLIQGKLNWPSAIYAQTCFFNTNVAEDNQIGDLYSEVKNRTWTFEKLSTLARSYGDDLNNDGIYDENDSYGIIQSFYGGVYNWSIAAGYTQIISEEDGFRTNYGDEKLADIVNFCYDLLYGDGTTYVERYDYVQNSKGAKIFFSDLALFLFTDLGHAEYFRNETSDYGIIPTPKWDEAQENYATTSDQWGLACVIPMTATDPSRTGAITEVLCSISAQSVYPTYYDQVISEKYTRDEVSKEMLDIIFSNLVYDPGITLALNDVYMPLVKLLDEKRPSKDLASWIERYSGKIQTQFDDLYAYVEENY